MSGYEYEKEFALRKRCFGSYEVVVRWKVPDTAPGTWKWSRWHRLRLSDVIEVVERLRG